MFRSVRDFPPLTGSAVGQRDQHDCALRNFTHCKVCPECGGTGHVTPTRRDELLKKRQRK